MAQSGSSSSLFAEEHDSPVPQVRYVFFSVYTLYIFNSLALFVPVFYLHLGTILNSLNLMLDTLSFHLDSCNGNVYCCSWTKMVGFGFPFQILFAIAMSCKGKNVTERDACLKCVNQASSN